MGNRDDSSPLAGWTWWQQLALALAAGGLAGAMYAQSRRWIETAVPEGWAQAVLPATVLGVTVAVLAWVGLSFERERRRLKVTQFALDQAGDPVMWVRPSGEIFYANDAACQALGYHRDQLLRLTVSDIDPHFPPEVWRRHWEELTARGVLKVETHHRARDGTSYPVEITARYAVYAGMAFNAAVVRDVRERKAAEEALRRSEEQTRLLLHSTGEGIIGTDLEGRCTFANPAALRMLGYEREGALVGKVLHEKVHHSYPDGRPYPVEACRGYEAIRSGVPTLIDDEVFWRADGQAVEVEYRVHPVVREGKQFGAAYSFADISRRRQAERALQRYTERLEEANRLKDLFTDILSHDLKNPAQAISLSAGLLQRQEDAPPKQRLLGNIEQGAKRLLEHLESAAHYAQVSSAEQLQLEAQDLVAMLHKAVGEVTPLLEERRMRLGFQPPVGPCLARADKLLVEAFTNLLSNAVKYGAPDTEVGLSLAAQEGGWLVSVTDRGPGIADADKSRLFSRFERLERGGVRGTGLGLAIARRTVELHHGRIWVEDNPGGGSAFKIWLPAAGA
jgi:PAS domain S-box-containing protein